MIAIQSVTDGTDHFLEKTNEKGILIDHSTTEDNHSSLSSPPPQATDTYNF